MPKKLVLFFLGNIKNRLHIGFEDPAEIIRDEESILSEL